MSCKIKRFPIDKWDEAKKFASENLESFIVEHNSKQIQEYVVFYEGRKDAELTDVERQGSLFND